MQHWDKSLVSLPRHHSAAYSERQGLSVRKRLWCQDEVLPEPCWKNWTSSAGIQKTRFSLHLVYALIHKASCTCGHIQSSESFSPLKMYLESFALICCYNSSHQLLFKRNQAFNQRPCKEIVLILVGTLPNVKQSDFLVNTFTRPQFCPILTLWIPQWMDRVKCQKSSAGWHILCYSAELWPFCFPRSSARRGFPADRLGTQPAAAQMRDGRVG